MALHSQRGLGAVKAQLPQTLQTPMRFSPPAPPRLPSVCYVSPSHLSQSPRVTLRASLPPSPLPSHPVCLSTPPTARLKPPLVSSWVFVAQTASPGLPASTCVCKATCTCNRTWVLTRGPARPRPLQLCSGSWLNPSCPGLALPGPLSPLCIAGSPPALEVGEAWLPPAPAKAASLSPSRGASAAGSRSRGLGTRASALGTAAVTWTSGSPAQIAP